MASRKKKTAILRIYHPEPGLYQLVASTEGGEHLGGADVRGGPGKLASATRGVAKSLAEEGYAVRIERATPPKKRSAVANPAVRGSAIWGELGVARAATARKATVWRDLLEMTAEDYLRMPGTWPPELTPVVADLPTAYVLRESAQRLAQGKEPKDDDASLRAIGREMLEQIRNASPAQIVDYAEAFYAAEHG